MKEGSHLSLQGGPRAADTTGIAIPPSTVSVLLESLCTIYITMRRKKMAPVSVTDQVQELSCSQSECTHYIANSTNSPHTIQVIEPSHKNSK